jgi:hypothetical protein
MVAVGVPNVSRANEEEMKRRTMYHAANEAADLLDAMARRLTNAADELRQVGRNAVAQARTEAESEWMRGARRELAELIRRVEGPNPPPAPRSRQKKS